MKLFFWRFIPPSGLLSFQIDKYKNYLKKYLNTTFGNYSNYIYWIPGLSRHRWPKQRHRTFGDSRSGRGRGSSHHFQWGRASILCWDGAQNRSGILLCRPVRRDPRHPLWLHAHTSARENPVQVGESVPAKPDICITVPGTPGCFLRHRAKHFVQCDCEHNFGRYFTGQR